MHTETSVVIRAEPQAIFALASEVARWPDILPHYRWVRVLSVEGNQRVVRMAAKRGRIPVRWTAKQVLFPHAPRMTFQHLTGVTRGMEVAWTFKEADGAVTVAISHELHLRWPPPLRQLGELIVDRFFIADIAGKTLRRMKYVAEMQAAARDTKPA